MNLPVWLRWFGNPPPRHFTAADCTEDQQLLFALISAVIPPEKFSVSAYSLILKAVASAAHSRLDDSCYEALEIIENAGGEAVPMERLKKLADLTRQIGPNFSYASQGFHPDILNEFPAQRLIQVQFDLVEPVDWKTFWPANGGKFHNGEMVALKWDPVWRRISFLGLPVAPFQLGSGYDLEDVDRDEAEAVRLIKPREHPPAIKIEFDLADLKSRLAAAIDAHCS